MAGVLSSKGQTMRDEISKEIQHGWYTQKKSW